MKVVLLAGGLGTRISEETHLRPKPMIEIGGKPILWHIMKIYSFYGFNEFIICCGYKGNLIKEYFANYFLYTSDITFHMDKNNFMEVHERKDESWKITLVDTGEKTQTAGRLAMVKKYIEDDTFLMTYGDGVGDINMDKLLECHIKNKKKVTLTAVIPPGRFGGIVCEGNLVKEFHEKPRGIKSFINGGFFVVETEILNNISRNDSVWEMDILPELAKNNQLNSYFHNGFWQPMDTLRDKRLLEDHWNSENTAWKIWE